MSKLQALKSDRGDNKTTLYDDAKPKVPSRRLWSAWSGVGRSRSMEMPPRASLSERSSSPPTVPLSAQGSSPGFSVTASPVSTPPKKIWENNFRTFLSSRQEKEAAIDEAVPKLPQLSKSASLIRQHHDHNINKVQSDGNDPYFEPGHPHAKKEVKSEKAIRGGNVFHALFGDKKQHRKSRSMNELDSPMRNGVGRSLSHANINHQAYNANVHASPHGMRHNSSASNLRALKAPTPEVASPILLSSNSQQFVPDEKKRHAKLDYQLEQPFLIPPVTPRRLEATADIKRAFTEFHNAAESSKDSTSAYLGDDRSSHFDQTRSATFNPHGITYVSEPVHVRRRSDVTPQLSASLPLATVEENNSLHKSVRMLRPFQGVDTWISGRRYLIAPAALAGCPLLHTKVLRCSSSLDPSIHDSILLGKALLSYVVPMQSSGPQYCAQRWSSRCLLVLRQNYLFEYDPKTGVDSFPRGYAHLQFSRCYAHPDFLDTLELEFYISPCAKSDLRVLTICTENRQDRDRWIELLNRSANISAGDLYEFDVNKMTGSGRYASVYAARRRGSFFNVDSKETGFQHSSTGKECALKVVNKQEFWKRVVKGRERADTLVREVSVQVMMTVNCPQLETFVRLCGVFETSEEVVLEMELLEAPDLFQYVSTKRVLPETEAAQILKDVLSCLSMMGEMGLAHRDVKPANILMCSNTDKSSCKLGDFGMSTFAGMDGLVRGRCGTPGYVAPEIFEAGVHGGYGNKIDIFSAGVTLYVMLCGYEPFFGETDDDLIAANKDADVEFPQDDWRHAKDLVQKMVARDPRKRISAKEALRHEWIIEHCGEIHSNFDEVGDSIGGSCRIS